MPEVILSFLVSTVIRVDEETDDIRDNHEARATGKDIAAHFKEFGFTLIESSFAYMPGRYIDLAKK